MIAPRDVLYGEIQAWMRTLNAQVDRTGSLFEPTLTYGTQVPDAPQLLHALVDVVHGLRDLSDGLRECLDPLICVAAVVRDTAIADGSMDESVDIVFGHESPLVGGTSKGRGDGGLNPPVTAVAPGDLS